jgi:hypothetical protein
MAEFAYNNTMHSSTQQTPVFGNHGLYPKFDIQGVDKITNLTTKDWAMWLANVRVQLVSNIEESQKRYKDNANEHWKEQPNFKVEG